MADAGVGRAERHHHEEVLPALGDEHAAAGHFVGQAAHGLLQLVLHLNLRHVDVGARRERQGGTRLARLVAGGVDVQQVVDALELLLDHLRDRVVYRFGRGAHVVGANGYAGRGDVGELLDRQGEHRQGAGQHDDDGQHPRKDGPVDEELRHG